VRLLLLAAAALSAGCAAAPGAIPAREGQSTIVTNAAPARSTGSRTQTVGLPLGRAGKIGLWAGVAVFLAYLMETDGEDGSTGSAEP
jgi:hypothetical protein